MPSCDDSQWVLGRVQQCNLLLVRKGNLVKGGDFGCYQGKIRRSSAGTGVLVLYYIVVGSLLARDVSCCRNRTEIRLESLLQHMLDLCGSR